MSKVLKTVKQIHVSLPDSNIRDFLSNEFTGDFGWTKGQQQRLVEQYKVQLAELQKKLSAADADLAILNLAELKGWELFDVSDYVPRASGVASLCPPFIGTREEHDKLFS